MLFDYLVVPGIIYDSRVKIKYKFKPTQVFSKPEIWNNLVNFVVGIFDTIGKLFGGSKIMKPIIKNSLFIVIAMNLFIVLVYFFDYYDTYQLLYIPNLILLAMFCFRNGAAVTFYSI